MSRTSNFSFRWGLGLESSHFTLPMAKGDVQHRSQGTAFARR